MKNQNLKSLLASSLTALLLAGLITSCGKEPEKAEYVPLMKERLQYETNLVYKAKAPQPYSNTVPPGGMPVVYQSLKHDLKGWIFKPMIEGKRPAVIYAHGGFALSKYDAEAIQPFVDAGYVVFLPAWRAENGNPGNFEMCYGEVVDAVNALNWLSNQDYVDSNEIYGAGNGIGATLIWLLAEVSPKLKKVAAFGANPSMFRSKKTYSDPPFNAQIPAELKLRSPGEFMKDLKCPLLLVYVSGDSEDEAYLTQAKEIVEENEKEIKHPVEFTEMVGADHKSRPQSAITRMLTFFATN